MWHSLKDILLDTVYPPFCQSCQRLGNYLCDQCYEDITFFPMPLTLQLSDLALDAVYSVGKFDQPLSTLIKKYKYQHYQILGKTLAELSYHSTYFPATDVITAVPLHPKKQVQRGFNQAEILGHHLSQLTTTPFQHLLQRTKHLASQASIKDRDQRLTHLQNAFEYNQTLESTPNSVLLLDDVTTTGTTLNECAKVLKKHGVKQVVGLTVAHGG